MDCNYEGTLKQDIIFDFFIVPGTTEWDSRLRCRRVAKAQFSKTASYDCY